MVFLSVDMLSGNASITFAFARFRFSEINVLGQVVESATARGIGFTIRGNVARNIAERLSRGSPPGILGATWHRVQPAVNEGDRTLLGTEQSVDLAAIRHVGKGVDEMTTGVAVEGAFASEGCPLLHEVVISEQEVARIYTLDGSRASASAVVLHGDGTAERTTDLCEGRSGAGGV